MVKRLSQDVMNVQKRTIHCTYLLKMFNFKSFLYFILPNFYEVSRVEIAFSKDGYQPPKKVAKYIG